MVDVQDHILPALLTRKFQVAEAANREALSAIDDANNKYYEYKGCRFNFFYIGKSPNPDETDYFLFLADSKSSGQPRLRIKAKIRILNWTDPSESMIHEEEYNFPSIRTCYGYPIANSLSDLDPYLDEDGILFVQLLEISELPPANPTQNNNNNN